VNLHSFVSACSDYLQTYGAVGLEEGYEGKGRAKVHWYVDRRFVGVDVGVDVYQPSLVCEGV
jgi:hypothetical protein